MSNKELKNYDAIVIGGGPGGYTAALYCARAGLSTAVLEVLGAGGQMCLTESIENYPGVSKTDGFALGDAMQSQAEAFGAVSFLTQATGIELEGDYKIVHTSDEGDFRAPAVILATGAKARPLGLPNEKYLADKGLHYCAACDGMRFKGKTVSVVGGGNSALEDAMLLARICEKVYLIHRRDEFRADAIYTKALTKFDNIIPVLDSVVEGVELEEAGSGNSAATNATSAAPAGAVGIQKPVAIGLAPKKSNFKGVCVKNVKTGEQTTLSCEALFVSVGRMPNTGLVEGLVDRNEAGYITADETTCTSCPGIFAVGDIRTKPMRQVVTAAADGAVSSVFAQQYIASMTD